MITLTEAQEAQILDIASQTAVTWEDALECALSEYRSILGIAPPEGFSPTLDNISDCVATANPNA